jgi:hypothetical protein
LPALAAGCPPSRPPDCLPADADFDTSELADGWVVFEAVDALSDTNAPRMSFGDRHGDRVPVYVVTEKALRRRGLGKTTCRYEFNAQRIVCLDSAVEKLKRRAAMLARETTTSSEDMAIGMVMAILGHELGHVAQLRSEDLEDAEPLSCNDVTDAGADVAERDSGMNCEFEQEPVEGMWLEEDADLASLKLLYESRSIGRIKPFLPGWLNLFADRAYQDLVEGKYGAPDEHQKSFTVGEAALTALLEFKGTCLPEKTHPAYVRRACTAFGVAAQMEGGGSWNDVLDRYHRSMAYLECESVRHGVGGLVHQEDSWLPDHDMALAAHLYATGLEPDAHCPDRPGPILESIPRFDASTTGRTTAFCFPWHAVAPQPSLIPRCTFSPAQGFRLDAREMRTPSGRLPDEFEWSILVGPGELGGSTIGRNVAPVSAYSPKLPGDYLLGVRIHVGGERWSDVVQCGPLRVP